MKEMRFFVVTFLILLSWGCTQSSPSKKIQYALTCDENRVSRKWCTYLHNHLKKRSSEKVVLLSKQKAGSSLIHISVNKESQYDYCIEKEGNKIHLIAKEERTMLWLIYQFMSHLASVDNNFVAEDLPPPMISMETVCRNFDFSYREPYFLPNLQFEYAPIIGTDMVETAWGLWGHGLSKITDGELPDSIYAIQNGVENKDQFCFSSIDLCLQMKSYILDNYGDGSKQSYRFMIMPNDNEVVCMCPKCVAAGNTPHNTMPALSKFIMKITQCFPKHLFFTTAYLTVQSPPKKVWPGNTGVVISTIDLPKGVSLKSSKATTRFINLKDAWQQKVSKVYIWDYAANFDDWMTPLPILYSLQKQLRFYKKQGIEGVFLNGSGYDYAPFDDVKTYVIAALMMNVDVPVDTLCRKYLTHFYPISGTYLADYYLYLEQRAQKMNKPYEMYGDFGNSIVYADPDKFVAFYDGLEDYILKAAEEEKNKLKKLQTALSFTRIQLALFQGANEYGLGTVDEHKLIPFPETMTYLERLKRYVSFEDMKTHKEENGLLDDFVADIETRLSKPIKNLLIGSSLQVMTKLDDDYRNIQVIQNGLLGYIHNYHYGWLIVSADMFKLGIQINKEIQKGEKIHFRFLNDKRHNILPPEKILIYKDGALSAELSPKDISPDDKLIELSADLDVSGVKQLIIEVIKQKGKRVTMALDELIIN